VTEIVDYDVVEVPPRWQLLRLETADGAVGYGEPVVEGRARTTATAVDELFEEYLHGRDPAHVEKHWQAMYRGGFYRGGPVLSSALSGLDQALWDLKGKQYGAPVYDLLGGKARDRIRLYAHFGGSTPEEMAADAQRRVEEGFSCLKTGPKEEFERIDAPVAVERARERMRATREAVGPEVDVAIDFHGRPSKTMAKRLVTALEEFEPMFYEEPVGPEDGRAFPEVVARTSIPIATGERLFNRWEFEPVLEAGVDVVQPDLSHAGGITECRKIAALAETYDASLAPHSPLGPVALAASLHVDACSPNALVQEQVVLDGPNYLVDDDPFPHEDGWIDLPDGPGLGVEVDWAAAEAAEEVDAWDAPPVHYDDGSVADW